MFVPAWNIHLTTEKPVRDDLQAVGIRAHSFLPHERANAYPVRITEELEEPFAWISEFRYQGQAPDSQPVWWRYSREQRLPEPPGQLGVAPADVLLLYE